MSCPLLVVVFILRAGSPPVMRSVPPPDHLTTTDLMGTGGACTCVRRPSERPGPARAVEGVVRPLPPRRCPRPPQTDYTFLVAGPGCAGDRAGRVRRWSCSLASSYPASRRGPGAAGGGSRQGGLPGWELALPSTPEQRYGWAGRSSCLLSRLLTHTGRPRPVPSASRTPCMVTRHLLVGCGAGCFVALSPCLFDRLGASFVSLWLSVVAEGRFSRFLSSGWSARRRSLLPCFRGCSLVRACRVAAALRLLR